MLGAILALAISSSSPAVIENQFDMVELNHIYNDDAVPVLDQLIFWDWHRPTKQFVVQAWIIVKDGRDETDAEHFQWWREMVLRRRAELGRTNGFNCQQRYRGKYVGSPMGPRAEGRGYVCRFVKDGRAFELRAKCMRETWTMHDPERVNRDVFPEELRRGLEPKE